MNRMLLGYLRRVGSGLARGSSQRWMRSVALATGMLVLSVGVTGLALSLAESDSREARAHDLLPILTAPGDQARLLYDFRLVTITDQAGVPQTVPVIWVEPLTADAPLPPGVDHWPAPGSAVLSPQVRADLGPQRADTWGRVVGEIDSPGLEVPNERRIYVRPTKTALYSDGPLDSSTVMRVSGFGPRGLTGYPGYPSMDAKPTWSKVMSFGFLVITPGAIALALGAGLGAAARRTRARQLRTMGATYRHLAALELSEASEGLALGTLLACAGLTVLAFTGIHIEALAFQLTGEQVRSWWLPALCALVASVAAAVVIVLASCSRHHRQHRVRSDADTAPVKRALICVLAGVATIWLPTITYSGILPTISYHLGVLIVLVTLPSLVAVLLSLGGETVANRGRRRGSPGALLAGRRLARSPRRTAWLVSGATAALLLFGQVQLNVGAISAFYQLAEEGQRKYGTAVVQSDTMAYGPSVERFVSDLPTDASPAWTSGGGGEPSILTITAPCSSLRALGLPCRPGVVQHAGARPTRQMAALTAFTPFVIGVDPVRVIPTDYSPPRRLISANARFSIVSTTGSDLDLSDLSKRANAVSIGGLALNSVGDEWLAAGTTLIVRQHWIITWGFVGLFALLVSTTIVVASDVLDSARETAPIAALSDRRAWLAVLCLWRAWFPVATATVLGAVFYYLLPTGMTFQVEGGTVFAPSLPYAVGSGALGVITGALLAWWATVEIVRSSRRWRPGA